MIFLVLLLILVSNIEESVGNFTPINFSAVFITVVNFAKSCLDDLENQTVIDWAMICSTIVGPL